MLVSFSGGLPDPSQESILSIRKKTHPIRKLNSRKCVNGGGRLSRAPPLFLAALQGNQKDNGGSPQNDTHEYGRMESADSLETVLSFLGCPHPKNDTHMGTLFYGTPQSSGFSFFGFPLKPPNKGHQLPKIQAFSSCLLQGFLMDSFREALVPFRVEPHKLAGAIGRK